MAVKALSTPPPPCVPQARYDELWTHAERLSNSVGELRGKLLEAAEYPPTYTIERADEALAAHETLKAKL